MSSEYVVFAFVRAIHNAILNEQETSDDVRAFVPDVVISLLLSYVGSIIMNYGIHEWRITDPNLLYSIFNAENKQSFASDVFEIGKLRWKIELYPNGNQSNKVGIFGVFLQLIELPHNWKYVLVLRTIECIETNSKYTFITKCEAEQSRGWATGSLFLDDVKHLKCLTFVVKIRILGIYRVSNMYYRYQAAQPFADQSVFHLSWNIDRKLMHQFRNCKHGQVFESVIMDDMWCLRCCPKGIYGQTTDETVLILQLCSLPKNINALTIRYKAMCRSNINNCYGKKLLWQEADYSVINVNVDYQHSCTKWRDGTLFFPQISECDEIEFTVKIILESKYDMNGSMIHVAERSEIEQHWDNIIKEQEQYNYYRDNKLFRMKQMIQNLQQQIFSQNHKIRELGSKLSQRVENIAANEHNNDNKNVQHEVFIWLKDIVQLHQYTALFINNGFDNFDSIKMIQLEHLERMGINKVGHRLKLMKHIRDIQ